MIQVPRLPCKSGHKNCHQKAVLGSWVQLGRHVGPLGADSGAMVSISGPKMGASGGHVAPQQPDLERCWTSCHCLGVDAMLTPWGQIEGHVAKVPQLPTKTRSPVARVPRLPHKTENKNEQQRVVLGSWGTWTSYRTSCGRLGSHARHLGVDFGPCCTSRAALWAGLGAMLDLVGAT